MDWEAWWGTVHGVTESRTRLRDFTFPWQCSGQDCATTAVPLAREPRYHMPHGVAIKITMIIENCHKSLTKSASKKHNRQIQTYINKHIWSLWALLWQEIYQAYEDSWQGKVYGSMIEQKSSRWVSLGGKSSLKCHWNTMQSITPYNVLTRQLSFPPAQISLI